MDTKFLYYDKSDDENVISVEDGKCTKRIAWFLRPCTRKLSQVAAIPKEPLLAEISSSKDRLPRVILNDPVYPRQAWEAWIEELASKYGCSWKNETGIYNSIMSSKYKVMWNKERVLGLVEFWCPGTNTFVFPWGEATVTLEDVMILGGFPVTGESISIPLTEEQTNIVSEMCEFSLGFSHKAKSKFRGWQDDLIEFKGLDKFHHAGFLALWLSRYVPSPPEDTKMRKNVFHIAALLSCPSQRTKLALAPAVLATLYKNLTSLRDKMVRSCSRSVIAVNAAAPLQLLLLWAFEHFPTTLAPSLPNPLHPGQPRAARWHNLRARDLTVAQVREAITQPKNFEWRPYAADYDNWAHLVYYGGTDHPNKDENEKLMSYFKCLRPCKLVGIKPDCEEKYQPQRVAMQFGLDQDLPLESSPLDSLFERLVLLIPPKSFKGGVSERYLQWWNASKSARQKAVSTLSALIIKE
ncbi:OLC1v1021728C1 [Oldenlandia corymbosa var. corymbosa]|uniref:OLC1v1021728C1 n=1 Tax=Oldenlandia corymbosa var. corymbosa TaxID=529605 RepID=A0AAV1BZZ2_OLDCO|nr:OLC1v1021728C1 [Oldenlandia corymbosa var. corymbosa]